MIRGAQAISNESLQTKEQLRSALGQTNFLARAFIKGDELHLYFTNREQCLLFTADWDRSRVKAQNFSSHITELKFDATLPAIPVPGQKWREPKVLIFEDWQRFARVAAESLVPAEAGHGIYLQHALGDAVLVRDRASLIWA